MNGIGTLVVNEVILPVTSLVMRGGTFLITADSPIKQLAEGEADVRLYGSDGTEILTMRCPWPKVNLAGANHVQIEVPLKVCGPVQPGDCEEKPLPEMGHPWPYVQPERYSWWERILRG